MSRRRGKSSEGGEFKRGRRFFETSSPFETYEPGGERPNTFRGLTDTSLDISKRLIDGIAPKTVKGMVDPQQYDNPRGYPGLALVQFGDEKPKLPVGGHKHEIAHQMEGSAKLAGTGKPGK